jgi:hypothetical protein
MTLRPVCAVLLFVASTATAAAQRITIRTVPVSPADQGQLAPSLRDGMGSVSIALSDSLADPFSNPAAAVRARTGQLIGSPVLYSVTANAGGGRALPLGVFGSRDGWFGGAWAALQQIDAAREDIFGGPIPLGFRADIRDPDGLLNGLDASSHGNQHAFAAAGRVLPGGLALGASVLWSGLSAMDGVDLLYAASQGVRQSGHAVDVRVGALREWEGGRTLQVVALLDVFRMSHDVTYLDFLWDPALQQPIQTARRERNLDHTNTWGVHVEYERPLNADWRVGWVTTLNYMAHPKIPNYEIMNIPRDPGSSYAYNFGIGLSKTRAGTTFGVDLIYEPIWSHTWADAASPIETALGDTIPAGGMTIENHFVFSNAILRLGVDRDLGRGDGRSSALQLGLILRSTSYRLAQLDHVAGAGRRQAESWVEWTPTWGVTLGFTGLEIRYQGRVTSGTGRPGVREGGGVVVGDFAAPAGGGIIVAPSGPLQLGDVRVVSHQVSIALPLR